MHIPDFSTYRTPQIHFGTGKITQLAQVSKSFGKKALLVTGSSSLHENGMIKSIIESFNSTGLTTLQFQVNSEPTVSLVDSGAEQFRSSGIDIVIAIGGGSVIDAGKAISAMIPVEKSVYDFIEGGGDQKHPGLKIPFIAVPTTSGTGSEASANSVLNIGGESGIKRSVRHPDFVPDVALVDPAMTLSCPPRITSSCGMDTLTQLIESYVSTGASPFTDALVEHILPGTSESLIKATENGSDIQSRTHLSYASLSSGITLANAGLGAVHGIAPVIGGWFPIPHGALCGLLLAPVTKKNISRLKTTDPNHNALKKYSRMGEILSAQRAQTVMEGCEILLEKLYSLKKTFYNSEISSYGVKEVHFSDIARESRCKNNPCELSARDIEEILKEL
ncbi:Alcohol dehydrogenase [Chitinispirillum alkaliphilum]|nr:Alcohol dehydrogenase [Chitinispirillum alkaliphilum]